MKERHLQILRHSLGLDYSGRGRMYRNHFCTGPGSKDWDDCNELVRLELMSRRNGSEITGGDYTFHVTKEGRDAVDRNAPPLDKVSRGRRRYLAFLHADCGLPFGEWLKTRWAKEVQ